MPMNHTESPPREPWLRRLHEVKVKREGDEVIVIIPKDIHWAEAGLLVDEALRRAGLHPDQLQ
jgi:hypothetical protein